MVDLIFLIVHYRNHAEIRRFCSMIVKSFGSTVVITDNSGDMELQDLPFGSVVFRPSKNLGYLNGCAFGLQMWQERNGPLPSYVCVCNTDIRFTTPIGDQLLHLYNENRALGCVAPDIVTPTGVRQNPHLESIVSAASIRRKVAIHRNQRIGGMYMLASHVKHRLLALNSTRLKKRPSRMEIYAGHGSCLFLTDRFFGRGGKLEYGGFLHDEEIHIAEQVRRCGLRTIFTPHISLVHSQHSSLNNVHLSRQSQYHYESLSWIAKEYYATSEVTE